MNPLWDFFWPVFAAGMVVGAIAGHLAYRRLRTARGHRPESDPKLVRDGRRTRKIYFCGGAAVALVAAALWTWPLGAGDRLAARVETSARATLDHLEMPRVGARLERGPLSRRLVLSGPADDFQRAQLVQILDDIRGVQGVRWATPPQPADGAS